MNASEQKRRERREGLEAAPLTQESSSSTISVNEKSPL
jgi:hypothetical protein